MVDEFSGSVDDLHQSRHDFQRSFLSIVQITT